MKDEFLPNVDISFFKTYLETYDEVEGSIVIGDTTAYVFHKKHKFHDRILFIPELKSGVVDFDCAMAWAIRIKCMDLLLAWLAENKSWKDGGYFVK